MHDWFHYLFPLCFGSRSIPRGSKGFFKLGNEELLFLLSEFPDVIT